MILWLIGAFLFAGMFPFPWLAVYLFGPRDQLGRRLDLRLVGSGNVGATNALSLLGWKWWAALIFLDAAKGYVPVVLASRLGVAVPTLTAVALLSVAGHCWPWVLRFKRGKGLSTSLGVLVALHAWPMIIAGLCVWVLVFIGSRRVSKASIVATAVLPLYALVGLSVGTIDNWQAMSYLLWAILVIARHSDNIRRLLAGTEPVTEIGRAYKPNPPR